MSSTLSTPRKSTSLQNTTLLKSLTPRPLKKLILNQRSGNEGNSSRSNSRHRSAIGSSTNTECSITSSGTTSTDASFNSLSCVATTPFAHKKASTNNASNTASAQRKANRLSTTGTLDRRSQQAKNIGMPVPMYSGQEFSAWKQYVTTGEQADHALISWKKQMVGEAGEQLRN